MLTVVIPSFNRKSNLKHILYELNMIKENFDKSMKTDEKYYI